MMWWNKKIKHCRHCRYYFHRTERYGECRYNPPIKVDDYLKGEFPNNNEFPLTSPNAWCGKYRRSK